MAAFQDLIRSAVQQATQAANQANQVAQGGGGGGQGGYSQAQRPTSFRDLINTLQGIKSQAQQAQQAQGGSQAPQITNVAPEYSDESSGVQGGQESKEENKKAEENNAIRDTKEQNPFVNFVEGIDNFLTPDAGASELEQAPELNPSVETSGSNNQGSNYADAFRNAMGEDNWSKLQEQVAAGQQRQQERKEQEQQRRDEYEYMIGASPQAQADRAKLQADIMRASEQQDRDLLMAGVEDPELQKLYEASLNQSNDVVEKELNDSIAEANNLLTEDRKNGSSDNFSRMSDMALLNYALQNNDDFRNYMADTYGYGARGEWNPGAYEDAFGDFLYIEDPYNTDSKRELLRDLYGLEGSNTAEYIPPEVRGMLNYRLANSGVDMNLQGRELEDAILNAYFDPNKLINIDYWGGDKDSNYQKQHVIDYDDVAAMMGRELYDRAEAGYGAVFDVINDPGANVGFQLPYDRDDIAAWAMTGNLLNKGEGGASRYTGYDLDLINEILHRSGDQANFNFTDDEGRQWNPRYDKDYSMYGLNDALASSLASRQSYLPGYSEMGVDTPLIDVDLADTVMDYISKTSGKNINRDR